MSRDALAKELADLNKGRGINRSDLEAGPILRRVASVSPDDSAATKREKLRSALAWYVRSSLPPDLAYVMQSAVGIENPGAFLSERLDKAGLELKRSRRTLTRYLREAEIAVAEMMLQDLDGGTGGFTDARGPVQDLRGSPDARGPEEIYQQTVALCQVCGREDYSVEAEIADLLQRLPGEFQLTAISVQAMGTCSNCKAAGRFAPWRCSNG